MTQDTNATSGAVMQLADQYAAAHAKWALEDLYGTSKSYMAKMLKERHALRSQLAAALASATPQADSQPARDERDDFEKTFPRPSGCIRCGTGYASTDYSNWAAHTHCERWQGWQARAARAPADSVAAPAGEVVAGIEAAAKLLERKADDFARENGSDDLGSLSFGRGAHADAKLEYHSTLLELAEEIRSLAPPPPAQAADSVLEDAARYRHIRDVPHSDEVSSVLIHQQNAVMDSVIDKDRAAIAAKKGGE